MHHRMRIDRVDIEHVTNKLTLAVDTLKLRASSNCLHGAEVGVRPSTTSERCLFAFAFVVRCVCGFAHQFQIPISMPTKLTSNKLAKHKNFRCRHQTHRFYSSITSPNNVCRHRTIECGCALCTVTVFTK